MISYIYMDLLEMPGLKALFLGFLKEVLTQKKIVSSVYDSQGRNIAESQG